MAVPTIGIGIADPTVAPIVAPAAAPAPVAASLPPRVPVPCAPNSGAGALSPLPGRLCPPGNKLVKSATTSANAPNALVAGATPS